MNRDLLFWFLVYGGFVWVGLLTLEFGFGSIAGVGLIIVGSVAVFSAHNVSKAPKEPAAKRYVPDGLKGVRPLTFVSWGSSGSNTGGHMARAVRDQGMNSRSTRTYPRPELPLARAGFRAR